MKSTEVTTCDQMIVELGLESLSELRKLECVCFDYHWTEEQFRLGLERRAFYVLGYLFEGILVGYLAYSMVLDEMEVLNLGVHPDFRKRGIGRELMLALLEQCRKTDVVKGLLDVKESNIPAISLYESLGFKQVGVRKKYYPDTHEDALLYDLEL
ncbi:ribosomal-protein-alanine N-acetyltransferase [Maridesulfovibrio ferrireducens]|uniref:[Ribosomal protein bS18]-alanine N-acetyltransferase n=1 Tax=Maridesulfovibrio ferrireducens TaxID=246191 RepID=A0A1G9I0V7_9BACT|nr:ribosomal protein S18-alanine N-acetyltransferase [Maridesulfovibrio ferrireducens]SDL18868.1 ribosomal-protein-alanine N-acetyltransferase [Maridesulfovibrio ferrireducens]